MLICATIIFMLTILHNRELIQSLVAFYYGLVKILKSSDGFHRTNLLMFIVIPAMAEQNSFYIIDHKVYNNIDK